GIRLCARGADRQGNGRNGAGDVSEVHGRGRRSIGGIVFNVCVMGSGCRVGGRLRWTRCAIDVVFSGRSGKTALLNHSRVLQIQAVRLRCLLLAMGLSACGRPRGSDGEARVAIATQQFANTSAETSPFFVAWSYQRYSARPIPLQSQD